MLGVKQSDLFLDYTDIAEAILHFVTLQMSVDQQVKLAWSTISLIINEQENLLH